MFGVKQPAISKHLKNIFESGELLESSVHSILEYTATDGKSYKTKFYNLDAILSVGYRVNSKNVLATIYTQSISKLLQQDVARHNSQYAPITLKTYKAAHDRFLIIDHVVYHVGASFKDLGKKLFAFSKMEVMSADELIAHLETVE